MNGIRQANKGPGFWRDRHGDPHRAAQDSGAVSAAGPKPVQAWRAWSCCGDGHQIHLIIDPQAQQVWLLPADDYTNPPRSVQ